MGLPRCGVDFLEVVLVDQDFALAAGGWRHNAFNFHHVDESGRAAEPHPQAPLQVRDRRLPARDDDAGGLVLQVVFLELELLARGLFLGRDGGVGHRLALFSEEAAEPGGLLFGRQRARESGSAARPPAADTTCRLCPGVARRRWRQDRYASLIRDATRNARRAGRFALITPVMTSTDGRCVARIRWMPTDESLASLKARSIPVFPVGVGQEQFERDIQITRVETPRSTLKGTSLAVDVVDLADRLRRHHGAARGRRRRPDRQLAGRHAAGRRPVDDRARELHRRPTPGRGCSGSRSRRRPDEQVTQNNVRDALVEVADGRSAVLYLEGEPRFEDEVHPPRRGRRQEPAGRRPAAHGRRQVPAPRRRQPRRS